MVSCAVTGIVENANRIVAVTIATILFLYLGYVNKDPNRMISSIMFYVRLPECRMQLLLMKIRHRYEEQALYHLL